MSEWWSGLFLAFLGLSSGVAVGSGLVAFLVVLDVIPRLARIAGTTSRKAARLEFAVVIGAVYWTVADLFNWRWPLFGGVVVAAGLLTGAFVGALAGALTEVLNVFPVLARRLRMETVLPWLLTAMVLGKVFGSLFEWLVFRIQ